VDLIFPWKKCRTRLAHQATLFARDHGRMEEFRDAVYEARYQQDLDIGDPGILMSIGERVGLDAAALREALDAETYEGELDELRWRGEERGVTGISTYVMDGKTYWGSDSTDEVLEAIANRGRPST
jgi:predicted DsbA family dithiol-disulfide isomerase